MIEFTDLNFDQEAMKSDVPVIVDFWAPWCGPCKMLTPILEGLADDYDDSVKIGKLNVDDNPQIASKFSIVSIPTMLFIKDGSVMDQHVGLMSVAALKTKIDSFIS